MDEVDVFSGSSIFLNIYTARMLKQTDGKVR